MTEQNTKCKICKDGDGVMRVPLFSIDKEQRKHIDNADKLDNVFINLCPSCTLLYSKNVADDDGPHSILHEMEQKCRSNERMMRKRHAAGLVHTLKRAGYQIYLRSDGRQLILSHEDGLDAATKKQVEQYRPEMTDFIISSLSAKINE